MKDYRTTGEYLTDYSICKNSNYENWKAKLKVGNTPLSERSGNRCKTEYLTVPKDIELKTMADKMAGCWDQYLEGRAELFDTSDNIYCAVCSVMEFEEKNKEINNFVS